MKKERDNNKRLVELVTSFSRTVGIGDELKEGSKSEARAKDQPSICLV